MAIPATNEDLWSLIWKSGLIETQQLTAYGQRLREESEPPNVPQELAQRMIRDGLLTRFQAGQLLAGKWQGFTLGKYRLLERIGEGGMGAVYLAAHVHMRRRVALKVLPPDRAKEMASLERFYREARAAAALNHPNIARAHDVDCEGNLHFLVMEYVDGTSLQDLVTRFGPLPMPRTLHYLRQAALGLQNAHENGLIHRDIKPGNLLLDRSGTIKILDMGLARFFTDQRDNLTRDLDAQSILGTADYIAPEQAMDSHSADIRSDIYSLGFTGFYMLTGNTPFGDGTATQKLIWHQTRQPKRLREVVPDIPEGVAAVLEKMMAKNPAERYQTPQEVADALQPFTPTKPPPPSSEEMPQLAPAALGTGVVDQHHGLAMAGEPVALQPTTTVPRAARAPTTLGPRRQSPSGLHSMPNGHSAAADAANGEQRQGPPPGPPRTARIAIFVAIGIALVVLSIAGYFFWLTLDNLKQSAAASATSQPAAKPKAAPPKEDLPEMNAGELRRFAGHSEAVERVALSPDGRTLATASTDRTVRLWDVRSGKELKRCEGHSKAVRWIAYAPSGLVVASSSDDHTARLWEVATGKELKRLEGHTDVLKGIAFSPDGNLATGSQDKTIRIWDTKTGKEMHRFSMPATVHALAYGPDGRHLLAGGWENTVRWINAENGEVVRELTGHTGHVYTVAVSPDGRRALSGGVDKMIRLWDLETGKEIRRLEGHTDHIWSLAFLPWGNFALSGGRDKTLRLWNLETGQQLYSFLGHNNGVAGVAIAADGQVAFSGSHDKLARCWQIPRDKLGIRTDELQRFDLPTGPVAQVALAANGGLMAGGGANGGVVVWDAGTGHVTDCYHCHSGRIHDVAFTPTHRRALSTATDGTIRLWDLINRNESRRLEITSNQITCGVLSPDERYILFGGVDKVGKLWDVTTGKEIRRFEGHTESIAGAAFLKNGSGVLTASRDHSLRLWDPADARQVRQFDGHTAGVNSVAVTADGRLALSASDDRTVRVWDVASGASLRTLNGHVGAVRAVAVSADGRYALSGGADAKVRLWDVASGQLLRTLEGHVGEITSVAISDDGRFGVSGGADRSVRRWDLLVTSDLAGHWKLDETEGVTAKDASGHKLNATVQGRVDWTAETPPTRALHLHGNGGYLTVANDPLLNPAHAVTIAAWIKPDNWDGNYRIVQKGSEDNQFRFLAEEKELRWEIQMHKNRFVSVPLPDSGKWRHVAGTCDPFAIRLFIDGVMVAEREAPGLLPATEDALCIGTKRPNAPAGDYFVGQIRDVRFYQRALTAAEIQFLAKPQSEASK